MFCSLLWGAAALDGWNDANLINRKNEESRKSVKTSSKKKAKKYKPLNLLVSLIKS